MLTALRQGGFLHTVRGPWGGFLLARPLSRSGSSTLRPALRAKPHFHAKERHDLGATGSEARPVEAGCADVLHLMIAETCKRRPVSGALAPVARFTAGMSRSTWSGVCRTHDLPVWGLAGKESDHGSGERCSGLDLISGDRGPGYAARGINNRGIRRGVLLLRLRGDVRATSPSSLWFDAYRAHLRCAHRLG